MEKFKEAKAYQHGDCVGMTFKHKGKTFEFKVQDYGDCKEDEYDIAFVRCEKDDDNTLSWEYGSWLIDDRINFAEKTNADI